LHPAFVAERIDQPHILAWKPKHRSQSRLIVGYPNCLPITGGYQNGVAADLTRDSSELPNTFVRGISVNTEAEPFSAVS
jgi:hypothetical protein